MGSGRASTMAPMTTSVVTGGAGFLGSHLCDFLIEQGPPRDLRRQPRDGLAARTSSTSATGAFTFVYQDVVDGIWIDEPVDFVFHLASPASPIDYLRLPLQTLKVGSHGTHNALGLAKWKRARFLISSTSEVYGDPQVHPQPETYWGNVNPIGPRGVYDEAKRYAEALTMAYHNQQGVNTAIARIFNTYGPRMSRNDGRATVTFLHQAIEGKPITVFGDGSQTRSLCYVDDLIRGLYLLAMSDEHLPVNIGNPNHEVTMLELAESCIRRHRLVERDRLPGTAGRRSEGAPARHHEGHARSSAGSLRSIWTKGSGAGSGRSAASPSKPDAASIALAAAVLVAACWRAWRRAARAGSRRCLPGRDLRRGAAPLRPTATTRSRSTRSCTSR